MSTYVSIHGLWHGAWCWYKIISRLKAAGHKVIAPDMPSHGRDWRPPGPVTMQDFVDTITKVLDQEDEPVVLIAHSRSGLQITHAAEARPNKVRTLVYLAAHLLPQRRSFAGLEGSGFSIAAAYGDQRAGRVGHDPPRNLS